MKSISNGKLGSLRQISSQRGTITLLAVDKDHRGSHLFRVRSADQSTIFYQAEASFDRD